MGRPKCNLTEEEKRLRKIQWKKKWRERNPEKNRELIRRATERQRQTTVRSTDGVRVATNKRLRTNDTCELCGKIGVKKLDYHHWDDSNPNLGLWVCYPCHRDIESYDNGLIDRYINLACNIDPDFCNKIILRRIETWQREHISNR